MKIRKGFVSNSSSSSFIIAFQEFPKSSYELYDQIWGPELKTFPGDRPGFGHMEMAEVIYKDMVAAKHLTEEEVKEYFSRHVEDCVLDSYRIKKYNETWETYHTEVVLLYKTKVLREFMSELKPLNPPCIFIKLEYSDDTERGRQLEKDVEWDNLCIMEFNHH